ncbi:hypothetical protein [Frigoribacterium salinisoli]
MTPLAVVLAALPTSTPSPLYQDGAGTGSPVPLPVGIGFGVVVVVLSFVVLLPSVRHWLDRVSARRPRRFRD